VVVAFFFWGGGEGGLGVTEERIGRRCSFFGLYTTHLPIYTVSRLYSSASSASSWFPNVVLLVLLVGLVGLCPWFPRFLRSCLSRPLFPLLPPLPRLSLLNQSSSCFYRDHRCCCSTLVLYPSRTELNHAGNEFILSNFILIANSVWSRYKPCLIFIHGS
jgi:hypothetical protein